MNSKALEENRTLRIIDSYTVQTALGDPDPLISKTTAQRVLTKSVKVSDWSITDAQAMKAPLEEDMRWLHLDDNVSSLANYNDEKMILSYWRTRMVPGARRFQTAFLNALLVQVHSDSFYRQFESLCDGILDFRSREDANRLVHEARVRIIRGRAIDSRWRQLELMENGEVRIAD